MNEVHDRHGAMWQEFWAERDNRSSKNHRLPTNYMWVLQVATFHPNQHDDERNILFLGRDDSALKERAAAWLEARNLREEIEWQYTTFGEMWTTQEIDFEPGSPYNIIATFNISQHQVS